MGTLLPAPALPLSKLHSAQPFVHFQNRPVSSDLVLAMSLPLPRQRIRENKTGAPCAKISFMEAEMQELLGSGRGHLCVRNKRVGLKIVALLLLKRASDGYLQAGASEARAFQRRQKKLQHLGPHDTVAFADETGFTLHPRLGRRLY